MSKTFNEKIKCPNCGNEQEQIIYASINVELDPEIKEKLLHSEINFFKCVFCSKNTLIASDLLYHDPIKEFVIWFKPVGWTDKDTADYKRFKRVIGEDNYFVKPIIMKDFNDFIIMVICYDQNIYRPGTQEAAEQFLEQMRLT